MSGPAVVRVCTGEGSDGEGGLASLASALLLCTRVICIYRVLWLISFIFGFWFFLGLFCFICFMFCIVLFLVFCFVLFFFVWFLVAL